MRSRVDVLVQRGRSMLASLLAVALVGGLVPLFAVTPANAQTYTLGVDVSHWQGTIDWNKVVDSGHVFAFHKATEGATFVDNKYTSNRSSAAAASIPFGAYHFARPDGGTADAARIDARAEARHFLATATPRPGDLVPVLDLEATGGLPPARLIAWTRAWLNKVDKELGVKALVYTSPSFWTTNLNDTTVIAELGFPLWIAHYTSKSVPRVPAANWNGRGWAFWQWTSCATVPGISGCADEDRYASGDLSPFTIPGEPEPEPTPEPATPPSNESPPIVSGQTEVGMSLTSSNGTWSGTEPLSYSHSWYRCAEDGSGCTAVNDSGPSHELTAADYGHRMKVVVTATNSAGSAEAASALTTTVTDTTAPDTPTLTHPRRVRTLASLIKTAWVAPESGIAYDVRYRQALRQGVFTDYADLVTGTTETSASTAAVPGTTYCFSVRATDQAGNTSGWSTTDRCTVSPLDDRDLRSSGPWVQRSNDAFYRQTFTKTKRRGAFLVIGRNRMRSIHIVAQRCPGCGKVKVLLNGNRVGTVSLAANRRRNKAMLEAASFSTVRRGQVKLVVVSRGAPVKIDGLALTLKR